MIDLPISIGYSARENIIEYRKKHNLPTPEALLKVYDSHTKILEEELELVTHVSVAKDSIEYVHLFPNLTSISFDKQNGVDQADIQKIIDSYPNLKKLSIIGQNKVQSLDLSKATKLEDLQIVSNKSLVKVTGLDNLNNMSFLEFYDNTSYRFVDDVCQIAVNYSLNNNADCTMDVLYYFDINKLLNTDEYKGVNSMISPNLKWCEAVGVGDVKKLKYLNGEITRAYKIAEEVIKKYIKPEDTDIQKYSIIYQWVCDNIKYDYEALDNNHIHVGNKPSKKGETNGSINGFIYGSCVCQGYSKCMQMLLKIAGIKSFDVACFVNELFNQPVFINSNSIAGEVYGNHSILKVSLDGAGVYYSDVTFDAKRYQSDKERKYFLLSKDDISKTHRLTAEDDVLSLWPSCNFEKQEELFKFAKERISSVDKNITQENNIKNNIDDDLNSKDKLISDFNIILKSDNKDNLFREIVRVNQGIDKLYNAGKINFIEKISMQEAMRKKYDDYEKMNSKKVDELKNQEFIIPNILSDNLNNEIDLDDINILLSQFERELNLAQEHEEIENIGRKIR